jgi:general secretion pathway protein A
MSTQNIYQLVDLREDPFRISPDPRFFYHTRDHDDALQRLYLSIQKKNGLNVVYGDYGTGKSTMAEILQRQYGDRDNYVVAKMATAKAKSEFQFYQLILNAFNIKNIARSTLASRTALETFSFEKNIGEGKTLILIIDEGEALTPTNIDILRTLLNFEAPRLGDVGTSLIESACRMF